MCFSLCASVSLKDFVRKKPQKNSKTKERKNNGKWKLTWSTQSNNFSDYWFGHRKPILSPLDLVLSDLIRRITVKLAKNKRVHLTLIRQTTFCFSLVCFHWGDKSKWKAITYLIEAFFNKGSWKFVNSFGRCVFIGNSFTKYLLPFIQHNNQSTCSNQIECKCVRYFINIARTLTHLQAHMHKRKRPESHTHIHVWGHTHTRGHIHTLTHLRAHMHKRKRPESHTHIHVWGHTHTHTQGHTHTLTHLQAHMHKRKRPESHTHIHVWGHTHTHTQEHTGTCIVRSRVLRLQWLYSLHRSKTPSNQPTNQPVKNVEVSFFGGSGVCEELFLYLYFRLNLIQSDSTCWECWRTPVIQQLGGMVERLVWERVFCSAFISFQTLASWLECSPMAWGTRFQSQVESYYKVGINCEVEQSRERSSALYYTLVL